MRDPQLVLPPPARPHSNKQPTTITMMKSRNSNSSISRVCRSLSPTAIPMASTLLIMIISLIVSLSTSASIHAVSRWKAPNSSTPSHLQQQWHQDDTDLFAYISSSIPAVLQHTGSEAFDEHLRGVQSVLRFWGAPSYLYNAGLFHSICELLVCLYFVSSKSILVLMSLATTIVRCIAQTEQKDSKDFHCHYQNETKLGEIIFMLVLLQIVS